MVSLSMTLSDPWPGFQGHGSFKRRVSPKRRILQTQLLYRALIGNHRQDIDRQVSYTAYNPMLLHKPCKRFASVARVCQRQLAFLVVYRYVEKVDWLLHKWRKPRVRATIMLASRRQHVGTKLIAVQLISASVVCWRADLYASLTLSTCGCDRKPVVVQSSVTNKRKPIVNRPFVGTSQRKAVKPMHWLSDPPAQNCTMRQCTMNWMNWYHSRANESPTSVNFCRF